MLKLSTLCVLKSFFSSKTLRSSNEKLLRIPKRNLKSFGQHSFTFMAPSLWNSLLATLRNVPALSQIMDRERGEGESMRDLGKRRRHGLGGWKERLKLVLFEIINILLIVVWVETGVHMSLCVCVYVCIVRSAMMVIKATIIKVFVCWNVC